MFVDITVYECVLQYILSVLLMKTMWEMSCESEEEENKSTNNINYDHHHRYQHTNLSINTYIRNDNDNCSMANIEINVFVCCHTVAVSYLKSFTDEEMSHDMQHSISSCVYSALCWIRTTTSTPSS